jgi:hypothetical protein
MTSETASETASGTATEAQSRPNHFKPLAAAALVAEADFLFYGHSPGISVLIFALTLAALSITTNPIIANRRTSVIASVVLVLSLFPLIEDCSFLSEIVAALGVATFALMMTTNLTGSLQARTRRATNLLVAGPGQLVHSFANIQPPADAKGQFTSRASSLVVWVVPFTLSGVFLWLFAAANPIMETLVAQLDLRDLLASVSIPRLVFWLAVATLTWSFVAMRPRTAKVGPAIAAGPAKPASALFGDAAILRSLILFNGLFALQTAMDIGFLWGGLALPNGMTYAAYAHRGAYPLMVTALLAGGFVIAAMQPGSTAAQSRVMRLLVLAWIAQNVLLVVSSILRLDLYIAVYSLTMWRIAAFIWMGLVAAGLVWLIVRIVMNWSNGWLIDVNLATAFVVLYVCCFVNFPRVIAEYNVSHGRMVAECPVFDKDYIRSLGPEVIPTLDALKQKTAGKCSAEADPYFTRSNLALSHRVTMYDWRAWSHRGWRLQQYLKDNAG